MYLPDDLAARIAVSLDAAVAAAEDLQEEVRESPAYFIDADPAKAAARLTEAQATRTAFAASQTPTPVEYEATDMLSTVRVHGCELRVWEPDAAQNDRGRMYVLDALGVTLLVREREDGTYVHVDDDGDTHPFTGPLLVEVNNGGEHAYGEATDQQIAGE